MFSRSHSKANNLEVRGGELHDTEISGGRDIMRKACEMEFQSTEDMGKRAMNSMSRETGGNAGG